MRGVLDNTSTFWAHFWCSLDILGHLLKLWWVRQKTLSNVSTNPPERVSWYTLYGWLIHLHNYLKFSYFSAWINARNICAWEKDLGVMEHTAMNGSRHVAEAVEKANRALVLYMNSPLIGTRSKNTKKVSSCMEIGFYSVECPSFSFLYVSTARTSWRFIIIGRGVAWSQKRCIFRDFSRFSTWNWHN